MSRDSDHSLLRNLLHYLRVNPQVAVLLFISVVLGLGTFIIVMISLATSGGQPTGDPDGSSLGVLHAMLLHAHTLSLLI
ncbi:MAG TPA: hypothetical protein VMD48_05305 [Solirubrobacteraceae bacterium]|nr:hypothetical protein [Solirubrobacteraceae bacterium]